MAIYYVSKAVGASDSNPGTQASPFLTIAQGHSVSLAGDIIRVQPGTYNEKPTITRSGSAGNFINYVCDGAVVCRGFDIQANYVRVIGFEVTHVDTSWGRGIEMNGVKNHIEIIDCYVHNTWQTAIQGRIDSQPTFVTIRGCLVEEVGIVPGVFNPTSAIGNAYTSLKTDHWLIEYNTVNWSCDFVNVFGAQMLVRNNAFRHFSNAHFSTTDAEHSDIVQPGSDGASTGTRFHIYERNFAGDSLELNSHFCLFQDTVADGDTDLLVRENIAFNFGSGGIGVRGTDRVFGLGNTFYKICQNVDGGVWTNYESGADFSLNCRFQNNIISDRGLSTDAIYTQAGNSLTADHNLGFNAGSEASYASTSDPLLVNPAGYSFRLQSGSPAIGLGQSPILITGATGSGTSFTVNDGALLCDGWSMVEGDTVYINGVITRVTGITGNTVTVANSVSWTQNVTRVNYGTSATVDAGALPFGSVELVAATLSKAGTVYTVSPVGDCRGVWFYVDGIPTTWVTQAPYSATIATGVVTAKAYALYAQATPVINAAFPQGHAKLTGNSKLTGNKNFAVINA